MKVILATASPYRCEAFNFLGLDFAAESSNLEERFDGRPSQPEELVRALARLKAEAVAKNHLDGIVIGFDSVGFFDGKILEKPGSKKEAFERLKKISGKKLDYFTGIHFINRSTNETVSKTSITHFWMRKLSEAEIKKYLDSDKQFATHTLGFDTEKGYSSSFIERIEGSYNNILRGIPLETIAEILKEMGVIE